MVSDTITWNFWPGEDHINKYKTGTETRAKKERYTESLLRWMDLTQARVPRKTFLKKRNENENQLFYPSRQLKESKDERENILERGSNMQEGLATEENKFKGLKIG